MNFSKTTLLLSMLFMFLGMAFYYPKWDLKSGNSTINLKKDLKVELFDEK